VPDTPPALTVILTEFQTIRAGIDRKATSIHTLMSLNVTAIAAVAGLVLADKADPRLLLVLPLVSSSLGLMVIDLTRDIRLARDYINDRLQPLAAKYAEDDEVLAYASTTPRPPRNILVLQGIPFSLLFGGVSLIALIAVIGSLKSVADWSAWCVGAALLLILTLIAADRGRELISEAKAHPDASRRPSVEQSRVKGTAPPDQAT